MSMCKNLDQAHIPQFNFNEGLAEAIMCIAACAAFAERILVHYLGAQKQKHGANGFPAQTQRHGEFS